MPFKNINVEVFDAMGVTFVEGDDVSKLLIPFIADECGLHESRGDAAAVPAGESTDVVSRVLGAGSMCISSQRTNVPRHATEDRS